MERSVYHEFEAYTSAVRDAEMRFTLPRLMKPHWSLRRGPVGDLHVQFGTEGNGLIVEGVARPDGFVLYAHRSPSPARVNGQAIGEHGAVLLAPKAEFCLGLSGAHHWNSVFVPQTLLCAGAGDRPAADAANPRPVRVFRPDHAALRQLLAVTDRLSQSLDTEAEVLSAPASLAAVHRALLTHFRELCGADGATDAPRPGRPAYVREHVVRAALKRLEEADDAPPSVEELAGVAGVSARTFRTVFRDYFGVPPLRYLRIRQLHQARRALRAARAHGESVTEVAARLGFWEFGRFAADYRKLFGESPSQTRRR